MLDYSIVYHIITAKARLRRTADSTESENDETAGRLQPDGITDNDGPAS